MDDRVRRALQRQNPWWFDRDFDTGIDRVPWYPRPAETLGSRDIKVLTGARRTGKSTIVRQLVRRLLEAGTAAERILLIDFDEPLLQSLSDDPDLIGDILDGHLAEVGRGRLYLFIDEVQTYRWWGQAIKTIHDSNEDLRIVLTGSTSCLLQGKMASRLSGRCLETRVFPLSFDEFLSFRGVSKVPDTELDVLFRTYMDVGGYPRAVLEEDRYLREEVLGEYYRTVFMNDIIVPNSVRNQRDVADALFFLISNVGKPLSYSCIGRAIGVSPETIKEYLTYAERSYLLSTLNMYDPSVRRQMANPKKIYCVDTGIINAVAFRPTEDRGRLLENVVHNELRRRGREIYYHRSKYECDFVIRENGRIADAIQATATMTDESTRKREVRGLVDAMRAYGLDHGTILTERGGEDIDVDEGRISVLPFRSWIMSDRRR